MCPDCGGQVVGVGVGDEAGEGVTLQSLQGEELGLWSQCSGKPLNAREGKQLVQGHTAAAGGSLTCPSSAPLWSPGLPGVAACSFL